MSVDTPRDRERLQQAVTYAAVGATQSPDLMRYPPVGYRPLEQRRRVGHGDERWAWAVDELLTGGVYRGAGMGVRITPVTAADAERTYHPVAFDDEGAPAAAAGVGADDEVYTASGERHLRPGDVIVVGLAVGRQLWLPLPTKVVLLEQEEQRVMYAVGTLPSAVRSRSRSSRPPMARCGSPCAASRGPQRGGDGRCCPGCCWPASSSPSASCAPSCARSPLSQPDLGWAR